MSYASADGQNTVEAQAIAKNILHHKKWNKRIMRMMWTFIAILFFFEGIVAILYCIGLTLGGRYTNGEYILQQFLLPCFLVLCIAGLVEIASKTVLKRKSTDVISYTIVTGTILVVSVIVAINHSTSFIFALFVLPTILSIVYFNRRILLFAYTASLLLYLLVLFGYLRVFVDPSLYHHTYVDMLTTIGLLTIVYLLSRLIFRRIDELIQTAIAQGIRQTELSHKLSLDSLTQLYNHATFYEQLDKFILQSAQNDTTFSLMILDLDDFKSINDTYGHDMGDTVILHMVSVLRKYNTAQDIAFRYGGEEFAILSQNSEKSLALAEAIREAMAQHEFLDIDRRVTVSIGLCYYSKSYGGRREFFSAADDALYQAKLLGKNRVFVAEKINL